MTLTVTMELMEGMSTRVIFSSRLVFKGLTSNLESSRSAAFIIATSRKDTFASICTLAAETEIVTALSLTPAVCAIAEAMLASFAAS